MREMRSRELKKKGAAFFFNEDGKVVKIKKEDLPQEELENDDVIKLSCGTDDFGETTKKIVSEEKDLVGKKKGFFSLQKYSNYSLYVGKKQRVSN